jgi:serine/threonine protein phosphatase 1
MSKPEYIWAIGDIHGYASSLTQIFNHIAKFNTKKVIYLGDYIDRGPEPKKVLDLILEKRWETVALMGNHELMLLNALKGGDEGKKSVYTWSQNGYETTLKDFDAADVDSLLKNLDKKYVDFFNSVGLFHKESIKAGNKDINILFCHAGPFLSFPLDEQLKLKNFADLDKYLKEKGLAPQDSCLWNSDAKLQESLSAWGENLLIHAHMRTQYRRNRNRLQYGTKNKSYNFDLLDIPNPVYFPGGAVVSALDIDTGVDIGGKLTAIGFSPENIDHKRGKILLKVIQADSERRTRHVQAVEYDLTLTYTDELGWYRSLMKRLFHKKKKKAVPPPPPQHKAFPHGVHAHGHTATKKPHKKKE